MKIIINPKLRKLRDRLEKEHIPYQDFMLSRKLLAYSENTWVSIFQEMNNINITKEQFIFLISIRNNNKPLYNKILELIRKGIQFGKNEIDLYSKNKDIFELLVNIKNNNRNIDCLNQAYVDMWGTNVIKENYDILYNISFDDIKEHIHIIRENPSILRDMLFLIKNNKLKKYLNQVMTLANKDNIKDIINTLSSLNSDALIAFYLNKYDDDEVKKFINFVIEEMDGDFRVFDATTSTPIVESIMIETGLSSKLAKDLYYCYLSNTDDIDNLKKGYLELLFNGKYIEIGSLIRILEEAKKEDYPIPEEYKEAYKIYYECNHNYKEKEYYLKAIYDIIYNGATTFNYKEMLKWVREFKCNQLNNGLIDPKKETIDHYEQYIYVDDNGQQIEKKIPIIKIDNPNFSAIVHAVTKRDSVTANSEISERVLNNPDLWGKIEGGNPNISMSYLSGYVETFSSNDAVLLGFSSIKPNRLIATYSGDAATPMTSEYGEDKTTFISHSALKGTRNKYVGNTSTYNEITAKRYCNGEIYKPDYIVVFKGISNEYPMELAKRWAACHDIPIVEIDATKIKEYHMNRYQKMIEYIRQNNYIDSFDIIDSIYEEIAIMRFLEDSSDRYIIPTRYEAFYNITQSIDINFLNNALLINELLNQLTDNNRRTVWYTDDYDRQYNPKTNRLHDPRLSPEKIEEMKKYVDFIRHKCQEVISKSEIQSTGNSRK